MEAFIISLLDGLFGYLATLPEKDREKVKAHMRARLAETDADIGVLADEVKKTEDALAELPPPEPPK